MREPLEALRLLQRRESVCRGGVSVVEAMRHESVSRGRKGANKGRESAHSDCRRAQRGCESIKHSHGLNNTLTAARKFL